MIERPMRYVIATLGTLFETRDTCLRCSPRCDPSTLVLTEDIGYHPKRSLEPVETEVKDLTAAKKRDWT